MSVPLFRLAHPKGRFEFVLLLTLDICANASVFWYDCGFILRYKVTCPHQDRKKGLAFDTHQKWARCGKKVLGLIPASWGKTTV